ncbi:Ni/Fe-hydrogenase, b-type cytochrome subunit [Sulfobacillus thermosulfidooxidans]|uniref:Ni/Fe-hydrogenase, b-type cytochrome subunit n=1 Tax=Sulfobacillus thermosulfidooxidans TaxID=28034 RepID=UPI0006B620CA|nr:Ni/Fe-hydrogenase, b-type cytochrome subunit [Sulfobacillus thermosulfidooxidans]
MTEEKTQKSRHVLFSPATRWMHWLRVGLIAYLVVTGFEIGQPFILYNPLVPTWKDFLMNWVRGTHEMAGFTLIATEIVRIYDFFRTHEFKDARIMFSKEAWKKQLRYYGLFGRQYRHPGVRYGPLQFAFYAAFYVALILISLTGILLFGANYNGPGFGSFIYHQLGFFYPLFGGLVGLRMVHIWLAWSIIFFVVGHVYMVIWNTVENRDGTIDTMLTGTHMQVADSQETE